MFILEKDYFILILIPFSGSVMEEIQLETVSSLKIGKLPVTFIADIQNIMY